MVRIILAILSMMVVHGAYGADTGKPDDLLPGIWRGYSNDEVDTIHWHIQISRFGKEFRGQAVGWYHMPEETAMTLAKGGTVATPAMGAVFGEEFRIVLEGETVTFGGSNLKATGRDKPTRPDNLRGTITAPGYITGHVALNGPKHAPTLLALCKERLWNQPAREQVQPGKTMDLACEGLPFHYKLHVPAAYDPGKSWPLLIHSSPGGNAAPYDTRLADEVGWISVGLTEAKNGDWAPIVQNRDAVLFDLRRRVNIDWKRITFGGESGGARASMQSWRNHQSSTCSLLMIIAGDISSSIPLPPPSIPIFFITGKTDMNRKEVEASYQSSLKSKRPTEMIMHDGGHTDGGRENVTKALRWLWDHQPAVAGTAKR